MPVLAQDTSGLIPEPGCETGHLAAQGGPVRHMARIGSFIREVASGGMALLLPDTCAVCELPLESWPDRHVCRACWGAVRPFSGPTCRCGYPVPPGQTQCAACALSPYSFGVGRSAFAYEAPVREIIHAFKYGRRRVLGAQLARRALQSAKPRNNVTLVPVPSHWRRRHQRGFNPAEDVAREIARALRLPMRRPLNKLRTTAAQASLPARQRRENLRGAFSIRFGPTRWLSGARLCLVDDVATTMSTIRECAAVLMQAGAASVDFFTIARTL